MRNLVKPILIISILLFIICGVQNVYAASDCKIEMQTEKGEYTKGDQIVVNVKMFNIKSDLGINSVAMTLEYDNNKLELKEMQGQNGWETPVHGVSYNKDNGGMAISKNGLAKTDENILKLTFIAKENTNTTVTLKNITASDATLIRIDNISKNITIKEKSQETIPGGSTGNNNSNNNGNGSSNNNNSGNNNNSNNNGSNGNVIEITTSNKLPKTGETSVVLVALISVSVIASIVYFIKIRK